MADTISNRRRKEIGKLTQKKYRQKLGQTLVEGVRAVRSAVQAGAPLVDIVVAEDRRGDEQVQALLRDADVPVYVASAGEVAALSDTDSPQGVLAVVRTVRVEEEALAAQHTILALDGVQDPGNVGTALRTAAWFGADAVLAGQGTAGLFHPKVVRAAAGALWDVQLGRTKALANMLARFQDRGFACYGAGLEGTSARAWRSRHPSVLVLGSEAHGLSSEVRDGLDERVHIEGTTTRQGTESLNVAVAAGILMYEWLS